MSKQAEEKRHIVPYRVFLYVLLTLIVLTLISVWVTTIHLGPLTVSIALLLASAKTALVLFYFMHLKFDQRMFTFMALGVILLIAIIIFVTFLDYLFQ